MFRISMLRGVSAGALTLVLFSSIAHAQEALPTIDVGNSAAPQNSGADPAAQTAPGGKEAPSAETGYRRTESYAATRTNTPLIDTPAAVQIVPRQLIEDKQILNTMEAAMNVSGVQAANGTYYDTYLIRGFASQSTWRNGLRLEGLIDDEETAFTERVEVVKGPSSVLYGRIDPGGFVNVVTKRPQEQFKAELSEQAGSWGLSRTVADVTGPIDAEKTVLYRAIGVYDHRDSFVNFEHRNNGAAALFLTFRPTQQFEFNTQFEHYEKEQTVPDGEGAIPVNLLYWPNGKPLVLPGFNDRPLNLPRSFSVSDPAMWTNFPYVVHRTLYYYDWSYRLNENWKVTQRLHYLMNIENQTGIGDWNGFDGMTINRAFINYGMNRKTINTNLDLVGEVETGPLTHKLLAGLDWYQYEENSPGFIGGGALTPPLNIYAPAYGYFTGLLHYMADSARNNILFRYRWSDFGVYGQDQISALDGRLQILLGGRWDKTYSVQSDTYGSSGSNCFPNCTGYPMTQYPENAALSPRAAALYKLYDNISVYGSYVHSTGASNGASVTDGSHPAPEVARQWEAGIKSQWLDDRLTASVALFDLRKNNVLQPDPANPGMSIAVGQVTSRGVEFDLAGQVTDNLNVIASYTFDVVKITNDNNNGNVGKWYYGAAPNVGNIWAKWDTAPHLPQGWEFGAGAYAMDSRYGSNDNSWKMPGYVKFDTMLAYRLPVDGHQVTFRFNVKNITDRRYFTYSDTSAFAYYGQPRTFLAQVNMAW
ncbi:TonB-dependent siderophore receptor [Methylocystis heyeri]|uniref:TonB-dependent siderophore receptor n=1 Tax=Methylocystis heyeri TaxID=391905 RepID=A0A6B8KA76_9HYPH|nr:TonB-dependent siderophore receptor [Methylocystis heyeri]QGM44342.1 TonB-dependent siderophore receptor [Methylocystis heyeri]